MRKVTIARPQKIIYPFIKGIVLFDREEREILKAGKTVVFEIPDGRHDIQILLKALPPTYSNVVFIGEKEGDLSLDVENHCAFD
jgi:hypothetical protein